MCFFWSPFQLAVREGLQKCMKHELQSWKIVTFLADLTIECKCLGFLPDTGDTVLLTGGRQSYTGYLSSTLLYPEGCSVPDLNGVLQHHTTFLTQDSPARIATCGGSSNGKRVKECWVLQGDSWRAGELDDLPEARIWAADARLEIGVFLIGGATSQDKSSVFLRANTSSWVSGPDVPREMWRGSLALDRGPCAAPISPHSFLVVHRTDVFEFDTTVGGPTSNAGWQPKEKWPQLQELRKNWPGCTVVNGKFIVVSGLGDDNNFKALKTTEIIDLEQRTLSVAGEMAKTRMDFKLLSINGILFALAGNGYVPENNAHTYIAEVEEFVEETGTWKAAKSLPGGRNNHGGVSVTKELVCGPGEVTILSN